MSRASSRTTTTVPTGHVGTARLVAAGVAMIAVGYGFARYGYGLLLPDLRRDLDLDSAVLGLIGSGSYVAYLLATAAAASVSARWGPRRTVIAGGACAAVGMAGIAMAQGPVTLGVGVLVAGLSSALVWPPFIDAVEHLLAPESRPRAHGAINSGTSYGVALSAPLALVVGAQWRWAWVGFAVVAVLATGWAAATLPRGRLGHGTRLPRLRFSWFVCPRSGPLLGASFLLGLGAAPYWTFAVDHVVRQEILSASGGRLFYAAIGIAGFAGAVAGDLVTRYPMRLVFTGLAAAIAASLVLLAYSTAPATAIISGLLFGSAYIAIIGVTTIWATEVFADRPSAGLSASMFMMGLGMLTGPGLAGLAATYVGTQIVFLTGATVIAAAALLSWRTTLKAERGSGPGIRRAAYAGRRMGSSSRPLAPAPLQQRLAELPPRERQRLQRRIQRARSLNDDDARQAALAEVEAGVETATRRLEERRAAVPTITYPPSLPVSQKRDELLAAIRDHQVVIVAGETGSGKTTQLPKICLELGRGVRGLIGHTQPRRIAARTVAERIAEELGTPLGGAVGYTVRFTDQVGQDTLVRLMTDGILLAEIQRDRMLSRYDTLIIDEAHERSLNVDFILGYLKQLLPRRPDLKVVITSATIDPQRFSRHFDDAPVVEVSGRTYPVEVRYRPLVEGPSTEEDSDEDGSDDSGTDDEVVVRDQIQAICDAVEELRAEEPGDVLVFLSGEREIRDTADALRRLPVRRGAPALEVLPLYARLSAAEQHRVFQSHTGRRVVLATNVAETSLTVPGIRYVVDPGTARISRYSLRTKVQRLPIEAISQASANQRKGRCGRVADGICIRLYSQEDFDSRPEFTDPEILRTNLASVILQMTAIGLGDIAAFPFLEPPDRRNVRDGVQLLEELGALDPAQPDPRKRLTPLGRRLSQLPVDPRLARMVLEADRNGCVREVMVIAAALSIQDPRERPVDAQQAADDKHRRFADETSDFLAYLNLWQYLQDKQRELSSSRFRKLCKAEYLHYLRVREWQDLVSQLRQVSKSIGVTVNIEPAEPARVHQSLLSGLLSHIGLAGVEKGERNQYLGARGAKFAIFPGSALFKKSPQWVMAAELVESSRLWARIVAKIDPEWVEELAGHLVKRSHSEPHWEKKRGAVMAQEKVTLYGVPIVASRKVGYGRIDRELSRELFIRHALVEGDWSTHHRFYHDNRQLLEEVEDLEHRVRRRDILVDDEALFDFYDQRIGSDVVSARHFDSWWKKTRREQPDLLTFSTSMLMNEQAAAVAAGRSYPDSWTQDDLELALTYQFEPGADADGVTVHVPLTVLNRVSADGFDWQVPGLRAELTTALIRSLPKVLRRNFVPAPDTAVAVLERLTPMEGPLLDALERELRRRSGVAVTREAWDLDRVPDHLRVTFCVQDERDRVLGQGKDLDELRRRLHLQVQEVVAGVSDLEPSIESGAASSVVPGIEQRGLRAWTIGELPRLHERNRGGLTVKGYPALVDETDSVAVRVLATPAEQQAAMWLGTRRLLRLSVPSPVKPIQGRLTNQAKLTLSHHPHASTDVLFDDCLSCALDSLITAHGGPAWDDEGFVTLRDAVRAELADATTDMVAKVERILGAANEVDRSLRGSTSLTLLPALTDLRQQLTDLVHPGFVTATGRARLPDLLRYLRAMARRLEKLAQDPARDRQLMARVEQVQQAYQRELDALPPGRPVDASLRQVRWMIEELRVSFYAQTLGTPYPVSEKRILKAMSRPV